MEYSLTPLTTIHDEDGKIVCCGIWKGAGALSTRGGPQRRPVAGAPPSGAEAEASEGAPVAAGHCRGLAFFLSTSFEALQRMESRSRVTGVQVTMVSHKRTAQQAAGGRAADASASSAAGGGSRAGYGARRVARVGRGPHTLTTRWALSLGGRALSIPANEAFASPTATQTPAPERSVTEFLERCTCVTWPRAANAEDNGLTSTVLRRLGCACERRAQERVAPRAAAGRLYEAAVADDAARRRHSVRGGQRDAHLAQAERAAARVARQLAPAAATGAAVSASSKRK